ncbi:MAG: hypothetical protein M1839_004729 [Geoglossum umbratile]|nr:MAG: hypothetical protein M1839_004729 [Geoglossum umbratile]
MNPDRGTQHSTANPVMTDRFPVFRYRQRVPDPAQDDAITSRHQPTTSGRPPPTPSLDPIAADHPTPSRQEKTGPLVKDRPPIPLIYRDMKSNLFVISMLLNDSPGCAKHDITFATHLSNASIALVSHAMRGISCVNEIETTGKQTVLPVQPWVLWAFVTQELCKTIVRLLSRKPSEILLTSIHPLQPVDSTLLEWEHHPSYMKWTSPRPSMSPPNVFFLLEEYAMSLKAAMGLLMIYAARMFGPVSRTCGDFNIIGYQDPDLPVSAPRNLHFGDPNVTVKNSPGIFIYEAGINVIETCKALEADKYNKMADELKDLAAEALFSSMTHMYPEKMQADLTAIERRIIPPIERPHALRATASEFHPGRVQPPGNRTGQQTLLSDSTQAVLLSRLPTRPRSVCGTSQPIGAPTNHRASPPASPHPPVRPEENPTRSQGLRARTSPATSAVVVTQPGPYSPSTVGTDIGPITPVAFHPELQTPQASGTQFMPLASPTFHPGFQIAQAASGYLIPSVADPALQAYQAAIIQSEEQLFLECRRTAQRLLGLPVSPKLPPTLGFWPPPAFWYYPPALFSPGSPNIFQNSSSSLTTRSPPPPVGQGHGSYSPPKYDDAQYVQTLFDRANSSPQILNPHSSTTAPSPDSHIHSDTESPNRQLSSQSHPAPGTQHSETARPAHPADSQGPAFDRNLEPSQRRPASRQRRSRYFGSDTRAHSRPLAPHLDDYIEHPQRHNNRWT